MRKKNIKPNATRTRAFFEHYTRDADVAKALKIMRRPRSGEPPCEGDELPGREIHR
jgi:hypothetical protein